MDKNGIGCTLTAQNTLHVAGIPPAEALPVLIDLAFEMGASFVLIGIARFPDPSRVTPENTLQLIGFPSADSLSLLADFLIRFGSSFLLIHVPAGR